MLKTEDIIGIIPARYASSRFPGKPLARLCGKPVLQWVCESAAQVLGRVIVATDDERIVKAVDDFGGEAMLTVGTHTCGTSRVAEVAARIGATGIVVNIQGDEPLISPRDIITLCERCADATVEIATLVHRVPADTPYSELDDPDTPKVVVDSRGDAMYFSRSVIPAVRGVPTSEWASHTVYHTHIGVYAYHSEILQRLAQLAPSALSRAESLEQLTWLEHGYRIAAVEAETLTIGIDTPADLTRAEALLSGS